MKLILIIIIGGFGGGLVTREASFNNRLSFVDRPTMKGCLVFQPERLSLGEGQ